MQQQYIWQEIKPCQNLISCQVCCWCLLVFILFIYLFHVEDFIFNFNKMQLSK